MHTSNVLQSSDFTIRELQSGGRRETALADFLPDYHPEDRVAIVSADAFDGVRNTAGMLLALTTLFYGALRARSEQFYDYPRHFAIVAGDLDAARIGGAWSWLDIWPDSQWIQAAPTVDGALDRIFRHQINRIIWPEPFDSPSGDACLPIHVRRLLEHRVKSVWYYRTSNSTHELVCGEGAVAMAQTALDRVTGNPGEIAAAPSEQFCAVGLSAFLERFGDCFASK